MRPYLLAIALLAALGGAIGGYQYLRFSALAKMDFSPPPVTIAAAPAARESWVSRLESVGSLRAVRGVELTAETSGQVTAISFDSGQRVQAGQVLVVLNDEVEQAARARQLATLELARLLHARDLRLIGQRSIAQSQFDTSKADLGRAEAELAETEAHIRNKRIRAPFAGTVGIRRIALGDYLEPGDPIASLQDGASLELDFTVPARHAPKLAPGQRARVRVDAWPGREFAAELQALDSAVDAGTRNILLRARMLEHEGLLPGMFASLQLELGDSAPVVTVPETAVTYSLQGDTVWVIAERAGGGLTAESRIVRVGESRDGRIAILDGLSGSERVVVAGQNKLYPGVKILVDESMAF